MTADLAVMGAFGLFGTSCVTALTVQSTLEVRAVYPVAAQMLEETLACLREDLPPAGIKIGMLGTAANVRVIARFLERWPRPGPVVLDPVVRSSSGQVLLEDAGVELMRDRLLPLVDWVTPNLAELGVLAGMRVETREEMEEAAERLGRVNVVGTGGHLERPDDLVRERDGRVTWLAGERVESKATHGTGCAFSTALLCGLVQRRAGLDAVRGAKEFVAEGIRRGPRLGGGAGPMDLLWPLRAGRL